MNYRRFQLNKLVRDKIPALLAKQNIVSIHEPTNEHKLLVKQLFEKLREEIIEAENAYNQQDLLSECADILEVLYTLCRVSGITLEQLDKTQKQKKELRGGFEERIFCKYVDVPEGSPGLNYYLANSDRYPEIDR